MTTAFSRSSKAARPYLVSAVLEGDLIHTALRRAEPDINSFFCIEHDAARWIRSNGQAFRFQFDGSTT